MKKILIIFAILLTSSCAAISSLFSSNNEKFLLCPNVSIPRHSAYLTQISQGFDDFQIQITGFEGYCYTDSKTKNKKAVITPIFEVSKMAQTKDSDLDFKFYLQTKIGPPQYLGKWTHLQSAHIRPDQVKISFKGKQVEMTIPSNNSQTFEIILGLVQTKAEIIFNQQTFDIEYDYIKE